MSQAMSQASKRVTLTATLVALALSGCATVDIESSIGRANQETASFTAGQLSLAQTAAEQAVQAARAAQLLQQPLVQTAAIELALINSPALQALLAQHWATATTVAQAGRIANPLLSFERMKLAPELELGRLLSVGLLDIATLARRQGVAAQRLEWTQLQLSTTVIEHVTEVRQAWVNAVAAQQSFTYAQQVRDAAEASAELARRMLQVGNFSKLQRARQQGFYADAATQYANASQAVTATRERLVRLLGLTATQAEQFKLPTRLPDLPAAPISPEQASQAANQQRLDVRMATSKLNSVRRTQGLAVIDGLASLTDIELSLRRDTVIDQADGHRATRKGYEVSVRLPLFDWGELQRANVQAETLAASYQLEATVRAAGSNLRESYSAYRTAYDISKHYRDEIVPLRKSIADENVLRYNGMLIGVFELLADARDQVGSVIAAIAAQQQFWLADAALQATLAGKPMLAMPSMGSAGANARPGGSDAAH